MFTNLSNAEQKQRLVKLGAFAGLYVFGFIAFGWLMWYYIIESNATIESADRAINELEMARKSIIDVQIMRNYRQVSVEVSYKTATEDRNLNHMIYQFNRTIMEDISKLANNSDVQECFAKTTNYNRKYFDFVMKFKDCCVAERVKLFENKLQSYLMEAIGQIDRIFNGLKREYNVCKKAVLADCLNNVVISVDVAKTEFGQISDRFSNTIAKYSGKFTLDVFDFVKANLQDFADHVQECVEICVNCV